ncbi:NUDIX domain-containing protein [Henriciella pelagia]|jgi:ADP-ribose pyrophosphatase YjhB (NUDIX family)|nr:NUDIX domain-containing protein [Henriciella pelagia]
MPKLRTRMFQSWFRMSRPMTLGVRAMLEDSQGRVLLVRHTYTSGLFLPGGGVEKGEIAEVSLRRELIEEAGAEIVGAPRLIGIYSNHRVFPNDHVVLYRLDAEAWQAREPTSRGEISQRLWIDPVSPPEDATPGTKRRLAEVYGGGVSDGYW